MQKNKLLFFTVSYPYGNSENFIHNELSYLASNFDEITIVPKNYYGHRSVRTLPSNVRCTKPLLYTNFILRVLTGIFNYSPIIYFIKEFFNEKAYQNPRQAFWWFAQTIDTRSLLANRRLKELLTSDYQICYFYWGRGSCYILPFYRHIKIKKIVRFHRVDLYEETDPMFFRKQLFSSIDVAVPISSDGEKYIKDRYALPNLKIVLHRLGSYNHGLGKNSADNVFRIVSCSFLIPRKRILLLAEAMKHINDKKIEWIHFGDGPEMKALNQAIASFPSNINVFLKGNTPNNEIINYYKENPIDLFINVSSSEGIPVSVMEAMSFGIPAMATNVGGTSELVDSKTGFLIDPNPSPEDLTNMLKMILSIDLSQYRLNSRNKWLTEFDADANYIKFVNFLKAL